MKAIENLKFDANGLIPAVIQDVLNHQVLMVGYMNVESVRRTIETGKATFWSRSRQKFWVKGETSGHFQIVKNLYVDCDQDCLVILVDQQGPACHEGYRSCFFREVKENGEILDIISGQLKTPEEMYGKKK